MSRTGSYGGSFAHKNIAFEFASSLSVEFKFYLIKEFQRLKADESDRLKLNWNGICNAPLPSVATREKGPCSGKTNAMDVEWRNKLILGDNKYVMKALLESASGQYPISPRLTQPGFYQNENLRKSGRRGSLNNDK